MSDLPNYLKIYLDKMIHTPCKIIVFEALMIFASYRSYVLGPTASQWLGLAFLNVRQCWKLFAKKKQHQPSLKQTADTPTPNGTTVKKKKKKAAALKPVKKSFVLSRLLSDRNRDLQCNCAQQVNNYTFINQLLQMLHTVYMTQVQTPVLRIYGCDILKDKLLLFNSI